LLLLLIGVLTLVGNTMDILPPQAFWAGLLTYPIGGYLFFMGSRRAIERAEIQTARALNPHLGNAKGEAFARQQEKRVVDPHAPHESANEETARSAPSETGPSQATHSPAQAAATDQVVPGEVVLYDVDAEDGGDDQDFGVTTDVSHPLEIQEQRSIADQLEKLSSLHRQGIISAEELAIAKAKLLG
jgi:hypothetical protein